MSCPRTLPLFEILLLAQMLIAPSLYVFYVDQLKLAHSQIVTGRSIIMGIGVVLSSYFWGKSLNTTPIATLTTYILIGFALFPLTILFLGLSMHWFYLAFLFYGIFLTRYFLKKKIALRFLVLIF